MAGKNTFLTNFVDENQFPSDNPKASEFSTSGWDVPDTFNNSASNTTNLGAGFDNLSIQDSGKGNTCHNCGLEGHFAKECTEPRKLTCFNCGQEGHSKTECSEPRKFKGECRTCGLEGHPAAQCPSKVTSCMNCFEEGHTALECKNPKKLDLSNVADKTEPEAWMILKKASDTRDLDDFKEGLKVLSKAVPEYTYVDLENKFRERNFNVYLIALPKDTGDTWTNVNLQGETGKKYAVGYFLSNEPTRPKLKAKWPATPEENLVRLADAGTPLDRGVDKCDNCNELGHILRNCPQERIKPDMPKVSCYLCGEEGHRVRNCTQERPKPRGPKTCRVCNAEDHMASECPNREKRTCRNCGSEDHMAKECDQPRNPQTIKCHNCDQMGHVSRDCTEKKDWSRVTCPICNEKGHGPKRYPQGTESNLNSNGPSGWKDTNTTQAASADDGWGSNKHNDNVTTSAFDDWGNTVGNDKKENKNRFSSNDNVSNTETEPFPTFSSGIASSQHNPANTAW